MVLDPKNSLENYLQVFEDYPLLKKIRVNSTVIDDSSSNTKNEYCLEFIKEVNYYEFLSYLHAMGRVNLTNKFFLLGSYLSNSCDKLNGLTQGTSLGHENAPSGPCIPGKQRLMVDINGNFFPCERVSETIERNCIGNVHSGVEVCRADKLLNISRKVKSCVNCFAFRHCTICPKAHEFDAIKYEDLLEEKCDDVRRNFHNKLVDIEILNEVRNQKGL